MNTMRVRGVMARAIASRSWPSGMAELSRIGRRHHAGRAGGLHGDRIHRERVLRIDGFETGLQEGFRQQHQQIVGAVAERDLRHVEPKLRRQLRVLSTWPLPSGYSQVSPIARCMAASARGLAP